MKVPGLCIKQNMKNLYLWNCFKIIKVVSLGDSRSWDFFLLFTISFDGHSRGWKWLAEIFLLQSDVMALVLLFFKNSSHWFMLWKKFHDSLQEVVSNLNLILTKFNSTKVASIDILSLARFAIFEIWKDRISRIVLGQCVVLVPYEPYCPRAIQL